MTTLITLDDLNNLPTEVSPEFQAFLPALTTEAIDDLIRAHQREQAAMSHIHGIIMGDENRSALMTFAEGVKLYTESELNGRCWALDLLKMFNLERSQKALTEKYWNELFKLTSFDTILPQLLWIEWSKKFTEWRSGSKYEGQLGNILPFDTETVYKSLGLLQAHQANFFAMRVKSVWDSLSRSHKTNNGGFFHERFIIDYASHKEREIQDLMNICAVITTGAENPFASAYSELRRAQTHTAVWHEVAGGCFEIKGFKVGTLHCRVHPEIANKLNIALAHIFPACLPSEVTTKVQRPKTGFGAKDVFNVPVPAVAVHWLHECYTRPLDNGLWAVVNRNRSEWRWGAATQKVLDDVLSQVGGVRDGVQYIFDYNPEDVIHSIVKLREIPQKEAHQFYPTPAPLAKRFVEWSGVSQDAICYETSAGTGAIAKQMPINTYCIELSHLRAKALDKMGFEVMCGDFLEMEPSSLVGLADAVLMNPPFAGRQWQDHFEHAVSFVREGGTIAAILPAGAVNKMPELHGYEVTYSQPMDNCFPDASVSVVFAKWTKPVVSANAPAPEVKADKPEPIFYAGQQDLFAA